jgi:hypothetical protein
MLIDGSVEFVITEFDFTNFIINLSFFRLLSIFAIFLPYSSLSLPLFSFKVTCVGVALIFLSFERKNVKVKKLGEMLFSAERE